MTFLVSMRQPILPVSTRESSMEATQALAQPLDKPGATAFTPSRPATLVVEGRAPAASSSYWRCCSCVAAHHATAADWADLWPRLVALAGPSTVAGTKQDGNRKGLHRSPQSNCPQPEVLLSRPNPFNGCEDKKLEINVTALMTDPSAPARLQAAAITSDKRPLWDNGLTG
jgi:hypothetical protein